ncbi:ankyrin repeat domain-containing protein [Paraflavitalea sp. CAU 1676]|uniref:ankyrin repeat domain-containing protein n=1 Tax=Paraflavitalea sp. CAU 1676 TaxID=3032598 RepID=UPI0023D9C1F2|nr:ankyrin repeat domain-containing protein [Paraflavitalea sp. CAU 1676]MDF2192871.1 ankyrin repeat domain-containing protein [Paraflavitalea sp. CAU 1676]
MQEHRHYDFDLTHNELCMVDWYGFRTAAKINLKEVSSQAKKWPKNASVKIESDSSVKKPGDILGNDEDVMIVSLRAKEIMESFSDPANVEYLPIQVCDKKGKVIGGEYFVVNPLTICEAMDIAASDLYWDSDGEVYRINSIVLQKEKVPKLPPVCRLKHVEKKVIINYPLATALYEKKCLLPWMRLVYNDAPEITAWRKMTGIPATATYRQMSISQQFIDAVKDNKKPRVVKLLEEGPFLNAFDAQKTGSTALMYAAEQGQVELLKLLLKAGASPNIKDQEGKTALYYAVQEEKEACVKALLEAGANPNIPRVERDEPEKIIGSCLETAVYRKFDSIAALLVKYKADPNLADHDGKIPFHDAESEAIFRLLFEAGTHPNAQSPYFSTPFHMVARAGSVSLLGAMLKKGGVVNGVDTYSKSTPLMEAAAGGLVDNIRFLLENGAKLEAKDKKGLTAIQHAFNNKHFEVVALLVKQGAKADDKMLKRIEKLQQDRKELAFDKYAEEMAAYIAGIITKNKSKVKFEAQKLQVNFDKEGALDFLALTGKTEKQVFEHHEDGKAANAPTGYSADSLQQLTAAFQKKHQLKPKDFSVLPLLCWQLHKHLTGLLSQLGDKPVSLLMVVDDYKHYEDLSVTGRKVMTAYNKQVTKKGFMEELAMLCLVRPAGQKDLLQLFDSPDTSYALDDLCVSIAASAVKAVVERRATIKHPVSKIKLLYQDFGSMLPAFVELEFAKGKGQYWPIELPYSPLPYHIDEMHEEDFLLPDFVNKHKLKGLEWGDLFQLPHSLLRMELLIAVASVAHQLKEQGIVVEDDALICIGDGEEDTDDLNGYTGMVQKDLQKKLKDGKVLKAFAALCYRSKEKQAWLQKLPGMKKIDMSNSWLGH